MEGKILPFERPGVIHGEPEPRTPAVDQGKDAPVVHIAVGEEIHQRNLEAHQRENRRTKREIKEKIAELNEGRDLLLQSISLKTEEKELLRSRGKLVLENQTRINKELDAFRNEVQRVENAIAEQEQELEGITPSGTR